jgi:hypothetical protein
MAQELEPPSLQRMKGMNYAEPLLVGYISRCSLLVFPASWFIPSMLPRPGLRFTAGHVIFAYG